MVAPSGRAYLVGSVPLSREEWGEWGLFRVDVVEVGAGRVWLEQVPDADVLTARFDELAEDIRSGGWAPPDVPAETKASQEAARVRREGRRAWEQAHPFRAAARHAMWTALIALIVAAVVLVDPTPGLSDIGRALAVILAVVSLEGVCYAVSIQRYAPRQSP